MVHWQNKPPHRDNEVDFDILNSNAVQFKMSPFTENVSAGEERGEQFPARGFLKWSCLIKND